MPKLRLVSVRVQPVFMLDDGENLQPVVYGVDQQGAPVTEHAVAVIPANEWPTYSGERFPVEVKAWQKRLDAEHQAASPK